MNDINRTIAKLHFFAEHSSLVSFGSECLLIQPKTVFLEVRNATVFFIARKICCAFANLLTKAE
jgi:hypothetical protein